jgi:hypothetical protein
MCTFPETDPTSPYVGIEGDPAAGFIFVGPFDTYAAAEGWAKERPDTWIVSLHAPNEKGGSI